jgi:hypothetical protein
MTTAAMPPKTSSRERMTGRSRGGGEYDGELPYEPPGAMGTGS